MATQRLAGRPPAILTQMMRKADAVAEMLRTGILTGQFPAGTHLLQDQIAAQYGVSSTPVREAFRVLETEGLVIRAAHRSVMIPELDAKEVAHIYEMRCALEPLVFERTPQNLDQHIVQELTDAFASATEAMKLPDLHAYRLANAHFHEALAMLSESRSMIEQVRSLISKSLYMAPMGTSAILSSHREHEELLAAIREGNRDLALSLLRTHLQRTTCDVVDALKDGLSKNLVVAC